MNVHENDRLRPRRHAERGCFTHQFKANNGMSPAFFQKHLKLQGARRMIHGVDSVTAVHRVGSTSVSQFTPEYPRLFGDPSKREVEAAPLEGGFVISG
jgi:methylphosphotriester-DNA--protein-cysteine methyltransferase